MPLYVADWFASQAIAMMTLEQEAAYLRLLLHSWASGDCTLPDDDEVLAALSRLGPKWHDGSGAIIRRSFKRKRGGSRARIYNEKLAELWKERREYTEKCREAGLKSGAVRRSKTNGRSTDVATTLPTKRERTLNSSSSISISSSITSPNGEVGAALPPSLDVPEFRTEWATWLAWRKAEKKKAVSASAAKSQLTELARYGPAIAIEAIRVSIKSDWQGLFPEKVNLNGNHNAPRRAYVPNPGLEYVEPPNA